MSSTKSQTIAAAGVAGFAAGALAATAVFLAMRERRKRLPTKKSHPKEYALFSRVDRDKKGWVRQQDVKSLCNRFHSEEHAEYLAHVLDIHGDDHITFQNFIDNLKPVVMMRKAARLKLWHRCCGIGVAGNVAGHMAQAGEAAAGHSSKSPSAIFTYYMPPEAFSVSDDVAEKKRLETFPVTYALIEMPVLPGACRVQVEPELGLYADIVYSKDLKKVERLVPRRLAAFNDCSIRSLEGSSKLSQKKNWGFGSKGISLRSIPIDSLSRGSFVDKIVIISYVKRDEVVYQYSVAAPARSYLMFYEELLEWIVDRMNTQQDTDKWEEIYPQLIESDYPTSTWIALGAGEYTEWGATHYMKKGDECAVFIYDETLFPNGVSKEIIDRCFNDQSMPEGIIDLHQTFV